eukprot:8251778-Pyramimonas_sp.AAC.1
MERELGIGCTRGRGVPFHMCAPRTPPSGRAECPRTCALWRCGVRVGRRSCAERRRACSAIV